jgi:hypothetical protein
MRSALRQSKFHSENGFAWKILVRSGPHFHVDKRIRVPNGTSSALRAYPSEAEDWAMLVERGVRVMNMGVVGDAYAIASNYLRRTGAMPDGFVTDERLLEIIVQMFHRGEGNKIRLANKAIAKFEALERV